MKRRALFAVFCGTPFLLAYLVAPTLLRTLLRGSNRIMNGVMPWTQQLIGDSEISRKREITRLETAARQQPNNAALQIKLAEWRAGFAGKALSQAYDAQMRRYPNEAWLIANRLRFSLQWLRGRRDREIPKRKFAGAASPAAALPVAALPTPTPEPPLPRADWQQFVECARRGSGIDPQNTYFDWMQIHGLLELHRDDEAFRVLHNAARKRAYNDYVADDVRASLAAREAANGPLISEERWQELAFVQFWHISSLRSTGRVLTWLGQKAQHRHEHGRALQIYGDLARFSRPLMHSQWGISQSTGVACQRMAYSGPSVANGFVFHHKIPPNVDVIRESLKTQNAHIVQFIRYARQHHRPDLVAEAPRWVTENYAVYRALHIRPNQYEGVAAPLVQRVVGSWNCARVCFGHIVFLLTMCGALSLLALWLRPLQTLQTRDVTKLLLCGGLLNAASIAAALVLAPGANEYIGERYFCGFLVEDSWATAAAVGIFGLHPLLSLLFIVCAVEWRKTRWRRENSCSTAQIRAKNANSHKFSAFTPRFQKILRLVTVAAWLAWLLIPTPIAEEDLLFVPSAPPIMMETVPETLPEMLLGNLQGIFNSPTVPLVLSALCLAFAASRRWLRARSTPWDDYGAWWLRRVWALQFALACWTFATLLFAARPARLAADAQFDNYLQTPKVQRFVTLR